MNSISFKFFLKNIYSSLNMCVDAKNLKIFESLSFTGSAINKSGFKFSTYFTIYHVCGPENFEHRKI